MGTEDIDYAALVMLVEQHWNDFVEFSGGEEPAELTLQALKEEGGVS